MSDTHGSASATDGAGAGNPGDNTGAATGDNTTQQTTNQTGQQDGTSSWVDNFQNPDLKDWAKTKGLDKGNIENALKSYHHLEKLFGADKAGNTVVLPGVDPKPEELDAFYTKLGRPDAADKYDFKAPEGQSNDFADWAKGVFFKANLTNDQAKAVVENWNEFQEGIVKQSEETNKVKAAEAKAALEKEWGAAYDVNVAAINRTAEKLGMSNDHFEGLRNAMGPEAAMKFVYDLSQKIGEHQTEEGGKPGNNGLMTPVQAQQALNALTGNKDNALILMNKSHPQHNDLMAKKSALSKMIAGVQP